MFRNNRNTTLIILLALAFIFTASSCQKLSPGKLKANYHFNKANTLFSDGRFRQAIEEYEAALNHNSELIEAYRFLGECYKSLFRPGVETPENMEKADKALEALNTAYGIDPTDKDIIYSIGDMYDKLRDFEKAEEMYLRIIDMDPTNMGNYYVVAEFYKRYAGQEEEEGATEGKTPFQKAEEMYLRRIETDPENSQGYAYIAQFYEGISPRPEFDKAVYFHEIRIKMDPDNPSAWLSKGVNRWSKAYRIPTLPKAERLALARDSEMALKKANELDATYPEPYSWLGVLYKSVLAKLEPDKAERYNREADIYLERFQETRKRQLERKKLEQELRETEIR